MKNYLVIIALLIFGVSQAQVSEKEIKKHLEKVAKSKVDGSVVRSLDTIYNAGIPYAVLKSKKKMMATDFTLFSLNGKELVDIPYECVNNAASSSGSDCYNAFLFLQSGKRGEVQLEMWVKIEELIVENDLVKDNDVNPAGENKFLMKYPPKFSNKAQNTTVVIVNNGGTGSTTQSTSYATVDRNRSAAISLYGEELKQDFKTIGTAKKVSSPENGKLFYIISFYLPDGTKIAEAKGEGFNATEWRVVTMKDNQSRSVTTTSNQQEKQIAKYLSDLFYL
ncbi:hypothetical protein BH09BAC5_BH09BAC5_17340 [soil metagenome]